MGASQPIGQYLVPTFVTGFRRTNPKGRVTACSGNTDEMLEALLARKILLAPIEGSEQRKDLHIEPFMEDHMMVMVPASHGWAKNEVELEDLKGEPLLMREFGSGSRRVVERALSKAGVKTTDHTISMGDSQWLMRPVRNPQVLSEPSRRFLLSQAPKFPPKSLAPKATAQAQTTSRR